MYKRCLLEKWSATPLVHKRFLELYSYLIFSLSHGWSKTILKNGFTATPLDSENQSPFPKNSPVEESGKKNCSNRSYFWILFSIFFLNFSKPPINPSNGGEQSTFFLNLLSSPFCHIDISGPIGPGYLLALRQAFLHRVALRHHPDITPGREPNHASRPAPLLRASEPHTSSVAAPHMPLLWVQAAAPHAPATAPWCCFDPASLALVAALGSPTPPDAMGSRLVTPPQASRVAPSCRG